MNSYHVFAATVIGWVHTAVGRMTADPRERERGDVPGWVLITLMSAGLVTVLWVLAEGQLKGLFTDAINSVRR